MPSKDDKFIYPLMSRPGIKRDGTPLDGNFYTDGLWCRFRNGRPKKIGGFREAINLSSVNVPANVPTGPIRGMYPVTTDSLSLHALHGKGVTKISMDLNGLGGTCVDRTPAAAAWGTADDKTMSVGALYNSATTEVSIIAHGATDLTEITKDVATPIFYGVDHLDLALVAAGKSVSGGCCVIGPYVFAYGSKGEIANCDTNKPAVWTGGNANSAFPASTKVIKGLPLRGGSNSPAGLFWSLAELIRVSFVGGTTLWRYDVLTDESSLIGKNAVVEYDGVYYWPGIDRFLTFNGVMREIPNTLNQDFFFDNVNMTYRNKVWGMRVARWGEIWWFFPRGTATECNWAVIYNVRENTWYDTPLPDNRGRAAGFPARELPIIFMSDTLSNTDSSGGATGFRIFQHEFGKDMIVGEDQLPVRSYFDTSNIGFASGGPSGDGAENLNAQTRITSLEPDFKQTGDMTVLVLGSSYAQDEDVQESSAKTFSAEMDPPAKVDLREQRRLLRLRFESNALGGDYHMGKCLAHLEPGDERG